MHKPVFHCLSELIMCTMRIIVHLWLNAEIISAIVSDTGRTETEEIKCLLMRALTADPLSVRVMNFEVFLEDFFHCNFPLKGQAIVLTCREKYRTALASDGRNKAFETLN